MIITKVEQHTADDDEKIIYDNNNNNNNYNNNDIGKTATLSTYLNLH
jgi:hypothetical protein